jgi:hypothetical protein
MKMKSIVGRPTALNFFGTLAFVASSVVAVSTQEVSFGGKIAFNFDVGFRVPIEARIVKGAPFSADIVTESIQTLSDGNRIVQRSNTRFYRDSEGRVRREEDRGSASPMISITDPVSGLSYSLDPENLIARQTPNRVGLEIIELQKAVHELSMRVPTAAADKLKMLAASQELEIQRKIEAEKVAGARVETALAEQVTVERLPARDIAGVRAEGVRRTTTIAAGAIGNELPIEIVSEEWTSPDLKILVMTERRDPRMGISTYRVTNINRAEPDRYLFEVPANYTVKETEIIRKAGPAPRK